MATGNPFGWQVENSSGTPVSGAKVYFKKSGTSTNQAAYTDKALTVPAANPVEADAAGWFNVYLDPGLDYDITIKSADDSVTYYTSTKFGLSDTSQPVDATLTALAGLTIADGDIIEGTGADAFRVTKRAVATLAALQAITSPQANDFVYMQGRASAGDGGGGYYMFSSLDWSTEVAADEVTSSAGNGGAYVALGTDLTGASGAWLLIETPTAYHYGAKQDATITEDENGTLSGTADSTAINLWMSRMAAMGHYYGTLQKSVRLDAQLQIPAGFVLDLQNHGMEGPRYRVTVGYENNKGTKLFVDFGEGIAIGDADYYDNCAVLLNGRSGLINAAFWYPGQDMGETTTPVVYPAAIAFATSARAPVVRNVSVGNAYIGIDGYRDHTCPDISNIRGQPIRYGTRIGSEGDPGPFHDVRFHPFWTYANPIGTPISNANSLMGYISQNLVAIHFGSTSWRTVSDCFVYAANKGLELVYQATSTGATSPGGSENFHALGCGFDACYIGIDIDNNSQSGNTNHGIKIDADVAPYDAYNSGRDNSRGLRVTMSSAAGLSDLRAVIRGHAAREHLVECHYVTGGEIDVTAIQFAQAGSGGNAVDLSNCSSVHVKGFVDGQAATSSKALYLRTGNSHISWDLRTRDTSGSPVEIANSSNSYYGGKVNHNGSSQPVNDLQGHTESKVISEDSVWSAFGEFVDNDDIDVNGILTTPTFPGFYLCNGVTETIKGLAPVWKGRRVALRSNSTGSGVTIDHAAAGVGSNIIRLGPKNADYVMNVNDKLIFDYASSVWHATIDPLQGEPIAFTIGLAASATTDGMDITITAVDRDGNTVAGVFLFEMWISEASTGIGLTADTYSGDLTWITGTEWEEKVSTKHYRVLTATTGIAAATLVDSANPADQRIVVANPFAAGELIVSAASGSNWEGL